MKKVSIIIPVYNSSHTLSRCLDSVLASTYKNLEILLLDDGSIDNSLDLCRQYDEKDERIKIFHHENHGVSYTRNRGLDVATGDFVMFVDSDDTISETWIEAYVEAAEDNNSKIVIGGLTERDIQGNEKLRKLSETGKIAKHQILKMMCECKYPEFGFVPNKIYDSGIIKKNNIRFDESMMVQEDLDFFLSYLQYIDDINVIDECGYYYDYAENKRIAAMINLLHNKMKIYDMAKAYKFDFMTLADEVCGHVYHYIRRLENDGTFVDNCSKLEKFELKELLPWINRKGEKKFVFTKAVRKKYGILKFYFQIRKLPGKLKK